METFIFYVHILAEQFLKSVVSFYVFQIEKHMFVPLSLF